jgi:hypothetical protein
MLLPKEIQLINWDPTSNQKFLTNVSILENLKSTLLCNFPSIRLCKMQHILLCSLEILANEMATMYSLLNEHKGMEPRIFHFFHMVSLEPPFDFICNHLLANRQSK